MSSEKEILALEDKRLAAMVARDFSSGLTDTKASWLDSMKSGNVALVRGRASIEAEIGGQARSLNLLFLNAWAKTPQGWKFAAWQSCPQPG